MNRPRNRQPRPQRQQDSKPKQNRDRNAAPSTRGQASGTVPTVAQVVPGADVWIVLKEDQPTGDKTYGVVQDVLTRGNHPRGIKVRLQDGQVGRVQRMGSGIGVGDASASQQQQQSDTRFTRRYTDVREDEYPEEPPPRSLADFIPDIPQRETVAGEPREQGPTVNCPFCEGFEGDEAAVTYHIDQEHLA